jgi:hypothetical protein
VPVLALGHESLTKRERPGNFSLCLKKRIPPRPTTLYLMKNWLTYDAALVQRRSIIFWISEDFEKTWRYTGEKQRRGSSTSFYKISD